MTQIAPHEYPIGPIPPAEQGMNTQGPRTGFEPAVDPGAGIIQRCAMESEYYRLPCRAQMPLQLTASQLGDVSNPPNSCIVVDLAAGQCRRRLKFDIERIGDWPQVPKPMDQYQSASGIRATLLHASHRLHPPANTPSASKESMAYRISGEFIWALNRMPGDDERLDVGVLPYSSLTSYDTQLALSAVQTEKMKPGYDP
jgi:hypothetical protein